MKWPTRTIDENGWKVPNDGTLSKRIYDLAVTGKTAKEIALEVDRPLVGVQSIMCQFMPRKPRPITVYQPIAERPKVDPGSDLTDAELDKMIDSLTVALKALSDAPDDVYRVVGDKREEFLVLRLDRDMEKFVRRFDPDGAREIMAAYEQGKAKIVRDGIPNFYRRHGPS